MLRLSSERQRRASRPQSTSSLRPGVRGRPLGPCPSGSTAGMAGLHFLSTPNKTLQIWPWEHCREKLTAQFPALHSLPTKHHQSHSAIQARGFFFLSIEMYSRAAVFMCARFESAERRPSADEDGTHVSICIFITVDFHSIR